MKTLLISVILFVSFVACLFSQNVEPEAMYFSIPCLSGTNIQQFDINDPEYIMNKFTLTWQWNNSPKLTRALKMNCSQGHEPSSGEQYLDQNDTGKEIEYIWQVTSMRPHPLYHSKSFTYKPTFTVDPAHFSPNANDSEKNIWGFKNRYITNPIIVNNRLRLSRLTQHTNPVLTNPWRSDNYYKVYDYDSKDGIDYKPVNGKYWRVSVNLRRASFASMNDTSDNAPVLSIVIPYFLNLSDSARKIKFSSKPNPSIRSEMTYTYSVGANNYQVSRGFELGTDTTTADSVIITRNMLPDSADYASGIGPDITINFDFITDGLFGNNEVFWSDWKDTTDISKIRSIGLDVHYHKTCDIHLNYIRIGNPMSHKLWKGELDSLFHSKIQTGINIIKDKGYKLVRFYGRDEIEDHYELWDAMRYFNKLVGGLAITEGNSQDERYFYRTESERSWRGSIPIGHTAVPHFRINHNHEGYIDKTKWKQVDSIVLKRIGYYDGFMTNPFSEQPADTLNSDYETWFEIKDTNRWHKLRVENLNDIMDTVLSCNDTIYK